jgi:RNA polymerase sigma factor (TIGR02999 family)
MNGESLPTGPAVGEITLLLRRIEAGDTVAADGILPLVYDELRRLAAVKMAREAAGHTLQPTALVHEAWLRLGGDAQPSWQNRAHFFGAAAEAMRRILIDRARNRRAVRHGGGQERVNIDDIEVAGPTTNDDELLAVHEALDRLAATEPKKAELVKLRYFAGLTLEQAAETMGVPVGTAKRWWIYSRAWLHHAIKAGPGDP